MRRFSVLLALLTGFAGTEAEDFTFSQDKHRVLHRTHRVTGQVEHSWKGQWHVGVYVPARHEGRPPDPEAPAARRA